MVFHKVRKFADLELDKLREQAKHFQRMMDERAQDIDVKFKNATVVVRELLIEKQVITEKDAFVIDTSYLEEHGRAYIRIEPNDNDDDELPQRTLH